MLSRVADSLYWISRYLERAEHTARLIDVHLTQMLDQAGGDTNLRWQRLLRSLRTPQPPEEVDAYSVTYALTFDEANTSSIVSCIASARENARQAREQISNLSLPRHHRWDYEPQRGLALYSLWALSRTYYGYRLLVGYTLLYIPDRTN